MKSASAGIINNVQQSNHVQSAVQVIAEWNQNRYAAISSIKNGAGTVEDFNADLFPIDSIALPNRPKRGVLKARVSEGARTSGIGADGYISAGYKDNTSGTKYVVASDEAKYKYWTSPSQSAGSTYVVVTSAISNCQPTILYTNATWTNKIVVGLENSYASPTAWTVETSVDGTAWTTAATNPAPDSDGRVTLYRQANGTWGTTVYRDNPVQIKGLRLTVTSMNKSKVFFNLIELSPRLESDLSTYVEQWDAEHTMSDHSFVTPLGTVSANTAKVTLNNIDARFTNDNPTSLYYGLLDKGVDFRINIGISTDSYTTVSKTYEWVRMATMSSDDWEGQDRDNTTVSLVDGSVYLQTIKPNPVYFQQMTAAEIVWRLLDSIGFSNYAYEKIDSDSATLIPHFWTDGEKTMWEILQEFAQPFQMAFYFDEYGILQIKTRNTAYNLTKSVAWQFDAVTNGSKLADIVESNKTYDYEANVVNVGYRKTSVSDFNNGSPAMEIVWEPEDTTVLRASSLFTSMTSTSPSFKIDPKVAAAWPFTGVVQVEGEFIRYTSKAYVYYTGVGTTTAAKYITSEDEKKELDRLSPSLSFKNYYSGYLWCGTPNRGIWNSVAKAHNVDASGYTKKYRTGSGTVNTWDGGWLQQAGQSTVRMQTNSTFKSNTWYVASRGNTGDPRPYYWGTRMKFNSTVAGGAAGIAFCLGTNDSGYFLELFKTKMLNDNPTYLNTTFEVCLYVRQTDGSIKRFGSTDRRGVRMNIAPEVWYDIDVFMATNASSRVITVMINGVRQFGVTIPSTEYPSGGDTGRFGLFTRSYASASFEYLYASTSAEVTLADDATYFDRISGGYQSNQAIDEFGYRIRDTNKFSSTSPNAAVIDRYNKFFMDEFGPIVHEVREFDVKFSKSPVQHSRLYFSNETQVLCPEYNADPFSAKFILANRSRRNAVVNGEDSISFGADNIVNQRALVYGRTVTQDDEQIVTVKDTTGIRRRGEVAIDINSDWLQSEAAAKAVGDWIKLHWAGGADEVKIESFGNPFLQVGDLVSINDPLKNMTPSTHKYFVVEISHSYNKGLETDITLRRAKI
jgi:hypothetical protein